MKRLLISVFVFTFCAAAQAQPSAKPAICSFIQKVIAAKADSFAAIRSTKENPGFVKTFEGKLTPDAQSTCKAHPPREHNGKTEAAMYICLLPSARSMAEMRPTYERLKSQIQACYADIPFRDEPSGSEATHDETLAFVGENNDLRLSLRAMDMRSLYDPAPDAFTAEAKQKPVALAIRIDTR